MTDSERAELKLLLAELDADEADQLRPTIERSAAHIAELAAENARLEAQAEALAHIVVELKGR